jgi:hypothetical protein
MGELRAQNQNVKPFTKRMGVTPPTNGIYSIRGDYTLIGNTNLTLQSYNENDNNSNNSMVYVDVDNFPQTVNSSSANLMFSSENGADPFCSEILYAGLYWSGRTTPEVGYTYEVTKGFISGTSQLVNNESQIIYHDNLINYSGYILEINRRGSPGNYYPRFVLTSSEGGNTYQFEVTNNSLEPVRYRIGSNGDWIVPLNQSISISGSEINVTFDPVIISESGVNFTIQKLSRDSSTNSNSSTYQNNNNKIWLTANGTYIAQVPNTVTLDKRKVKIKGPQSSEYTEITASNSNILYPNGEFADIYVGYADVTQYIKENGLGEYTVADVALVEGNGGTTGYFGQWGIVIVYENSKLPWRDIALFDGYSFVRSPGE